MVETMEMPQIRKVSVPEIFRFSVDYDDDPFERMMTSAGRHLLMDSVVRREHFPIERGKGVVKFEGRYFSWRFPMSSILASKGIGLADYKRPWQLAKIEHLFALGTCKPEGLHGNRSVVGLGSVAIIEGKRCVPCMGGVNSIWSLSLSPLELNWGVHTDFFAVREAVS